MSVAKGIAQAKAYQGASTVLTFQIGILAMGISIEASSWWIGISAFFVIGISACFKWTRVPVLLVLSAFWSRLFYEIGQATDVGLWSYLIALIAFVISFGYNWAGGIGLSHSVPEYE